MKSLDYTSSNSGGMTNKPVITCAGDWNLFCTLEAPLVAAIPQDTCEWRRSYGRVTKSVTLEAGFVKYKQDKVQVDNTWNLLKRPIFHIYWTDCVDIEYYKTVLRDDIETWMKNLESKGISDWMVVLVETYDIRKTTKLLPRTTVLDKIRGEFAVKQTEDRFITVINPIKSEARSAESWRGLVGKIRHFVLLAYNKALVKFEEFMREQREKRNDPEWDFCKYFILQEQLAFVLEMLSLHEESLVQYDELDALFSQFVLNSTVTKSPKWLDSFRQPITSWRAVAITTDVCHSLRDLIIKRRASLLEFRSYLFQRQCAMLLLLKKPWEVPTRCLATVHNAVRELSLLGAPLPEGAAACWALLACTGALQACAERPPADSAGVELCTARQAPALHYAKDKLHDLGKLCGLLPGSPDPSSEQLHLVVTLSAGAGDGATPASPAERLRAALSHRASFQQYYLELAELAMGTYKHIGRLRFARLIGRELAAFYAELGETGKAAVFLLDALRSYEEQGWRALAAQTRLELVACAKKMEDRPRYTKLCATIASTPELEILVRHFYHEEMLKSIAALRDSPESVLADLADCFKIVSVSLLPSERGAYITDNTVECCLIVESLLPKDVVCTRALISVELCKDPGRTPVKGHKTDLNVNSSFSDAASPKKAAKVEPEAANLVMSVKLDDLKPKNPLLHPLAITAQLHYKEDKTLHKTTVDCQHTKVTLKRSDSSKYRKPSTVQRHAYVTCLTAVNVTFRPGANRVTLAYAPSEPGTFRLGQVSLLVEDKLEFVANSLIGANVGYDVVTQGVNVVLNKIDTKKDLVAGLEHVMELVVTSGSSSIQENSSIQLRASAGLQLRLVGGAAFTRDLEVPVPQLGPFETSRIALQMFAGLQTKNKDKVIEHSVWISCPWWESPVEVPLHFTPPLVASWRLLTSNTRKFVQVTLKTTVAHPALFTLTDAKLECDGDSKVTDLNPKNAGDMTVSSDGVTASFVWEMLTYPLVPAAPVKCSFSAQYAPDDSHADAGTARSFACSFDLRAYATLFVARSRLEPGKGADFCRASQVCCLQLCVQRVNETEHTSLMYEVLADQSMWAVLGRTAGVITLDQECIEPQSVRLDVMPLVAGFLPLPAVRLSKYIAANTKDPKKDISSHPRLEPFSPGQVYHAGKARQVHVLPPLPKDGDGGN